MRLEVRWPQILGAAAMMAVLTSGGLAWAQIFGGTEKSEFQRGTGGPAGSQSGASGSKPMTFGLKGRWKLESPKPAMCSTNYYSLKEAGCLKSVLFVPGSSPAGKRWVRYTNTCNHAVRYRQDDYLPNRFTNERNFFGYDSVDFYPRETQTFLVPFDGDREPNPEGIAICAALARPSVESPAPGVWVGVACGGFGSKRSCADWLFTFSTNGAFSMEPLNRSQPPDRGRWTQSGEEVTVDMGSNTKINLVVRQGEMTGRTSGYMVRPADWALFRR